MLGETMDGLTGFEPGLAPGLALDALPDQAARAAIPRGAPRAAPTRVLVDLSHAADGYVGVAQDARMIFAMLAGLPGVAASGLLMPAGRHDLPRVHPAAAHPGALTAAVLHCMEQVWDGPARGRSLRPFPYSVVQKARIAWQVLRARHDVLDMTDEGQLNAIWRVLFARTLPASARSALLGRPFVATDLSVSSIILRAAFLPWAPEKRLGVRDADAVLFSMPRPVRLPRGVRQIVRYHDSVPVTDADTVADWRMAMVHSRLVRGCAPEALFVCNSPQSRDSLLALDPTREGRTAVIPCALAPVVAPPDVRAADVIARTVTFRALEQTVAPAGWAAPAPGCRYVLAVSTLEPRKNFTGLIRAMERVTARLGPDGDALKLVLVGGQGWRERDILAAMRPGVASGRIYHLQNVGAEDLAALLAQAAAFASVPFNEGFGFSPLEAAQAGAPCVISDLPVFRWTFGDAAIYADPYDIDHIAAGLTRLLDPATGPAEARRLRALTPPSLARFRPDVVASAWADLLVGATAAA